MSEILLLLHQREDLPLRYPLSCNYIVCSIHLQASEKDKGKQDYSHFICEFVYIQHSAKSESNYVIFNVFPHLNKSLLGRSLEMYHF